MNRVAFVPSPSWPTKLAPHASTEPPVSTATLCPVPAETVLTPVRNDEHGAVCPTAHTRTGTDRSTLVPSPSLPELLEPQANTVPPAPTAMVWLKLLAATPV